MPASVLLFCTHRESPGKQSLRFPCFYFGKQTCILPAFSKFTGAVAMDKSSATDIFAIVENELVKI